jgi:hypothetical protein
LAENKCYAFSLSLSGTASALGTLAATAQRHYVKNTTNNILQLKNKTSTFSGTLQKGETPTALLQRA